MAEGIRKRHSKGCSAREGGRCNCKAGWEATVYLMRENRRVSKSFPREAEARSWRADAKRTVENGSSASQGRDARTLIEGLWQLIAGMEAGSIRPKGRRRYKPNTIRSYERAVRVHIEPSRLADIGATDLRRRDLQDFADELLASGFEPATVSNVLNPIQTYYRWKIDREVPSHNPGELAHSPSRQARELART